MESLRDVRRAMEREIKKGSCPLMFDRLEFGGKPFQFIMSEEKLDEVLAYLLRLKSFRQYAEKTIINNVYMDLDMLCRKPQFKRTHSVIDREGIYARAQRYKKRLQPDYDRGLCLETVRCVFTLPEGEAEKYRITHDGQETYAFIMSNKYILGLFTHCEAARKSVVPKIVVPNASLTASVIFDASFTSAIKLIVVNVIINRSFLSVILILN